eukprot:jgi/Chlat1/3520/Chrsp23S03799
MADGKRRHVEVAGEDSVNVFVDRPDPSLLCSACFRLLRRPLQARCGHVFCGACAEKEYVATGRCPLDRRPLLPPDKMLRMPDLQARVDGLLVHCTHACVLTDTGWDVDEESCPEVLRWGRRHSHERLCDYASVACPAGGEKCAQVDSLEVVTHVVVWSMLLFGLLQTHFVGELLRDAQTPLTLLLCCPLALFGAVLLANYFMGGSL